MKVRALISFVSETVSPTEGDVFDVPEPQAAAWIKARLVEVVPVVAVPLAPPVFEEAVTPLPEAAVLKKRGRR